MNTAAVIMKCYGEKPQDNLLASFLHLASIAPPDLKSNVFIDLITIKVTI